MCTTLQLNWKITTTTMQDKDKYKLREGSIKKRIEVEHRKKEPKKRGPKPRPKPLPMSKYRRKTANLRERQRMGEINVAFEKLREKIPTPVQATNAVARCEKMTKINILHVAINYIRALESILDTGDAGVHIYGTSVVQSPNLPIHVEAEMPVEKPAIKNPPKINPNSIRRATAKKQNQLTSGANLSRTKNPSSSSTGSAADSGINMDSSAEESNNEDVICPDWTELTSTLELIPPRGNLDTLLSSTADTGTGPVNKPILQAKDLNRNLSTSSSFDLFPDLNASFDHLESSMFIETCDPFDQLVVF